LPWSANISSALVCNLLIVLKTAQVPLYLNADVVLFVGTYFLVHATHSALFLDILFVLVL
jgi:hypothetical protein